MPELSRERRYEEALLRIVVLVNTPYIHRRRGESEGIPAGPKMQLIEDIAKAALEPIGGNEHAQVASARLILRAADRLAAAVAHRIDLRHLDARSEVGDALLEYDSLDDHRAALGIEPREGKLGT